MRKIATFFFLLISSVALYGQTSCVEGTVVDTAGSPIADIDVVGVNSRANFSIETATDSVGHFVFFNLTPGNYQFATSDEYWKNGHFRRRGEGDSTQEEVAELADSDQCATVTLRRAIRARLRFQVTDQLTGAEIHAHAEFRLLTSRSSSAPFWKGSQTRQGELLVPPGALLELQVFATGYADSEVLNVGPFESAEQRTISLGLRPLQTGCITGTVVDDEGTPVPNVSVQAVFAGEHRSASFGGTPTNKDGRFRFDTLQPGRWSIFTNASGYLPPMFRSGHASTEVAPGAGCVDVTVPLGPKPARLEISVLDAATGKSIPNPEIWAMGDYNGNGGWSLRLMDKATLAPALMQFTISATAQGYQGAHVTVSPLSPESLEKITIVMDRKASRSPQGND